MSDHKELRELLTEWNNHWGCGEPCHGGVVSRESLAALLTDYDQLRLRCDELAGALEDIEHAPTGLDCTRIARTALAKYREGNNG